MSNSTISGNSTVGSGGGFYAQTLYPGATVTLENSTITLNRADSDSTLDNRGGGMVVYGYAANTLVTMTNTIVSGNTDPSGTAPDIFDSGSYAAADV